MTNGAAALQLVDLPSASAPADATLPVSEAELGEAVAFATAALRLAGSIRPSRPR